MNKLIFWAAIICLLGCKTDSFERFDLSLVDAEIDLMGFEHLYAGPSSDIDTENDLHNAGCKHRIFVSFYEIYSVVFIDKISLNIEGGPEKQMWFKRIDLDPMYTKYPFFHETDHFSFIEWINSDEFTFKISDKRFSAKICTEGRLLNVSEY